MATPSETAPPGGRGPRPVTAGDTTAERPWPVRLLTAKIGAYIERMPQCWVEGQVVQLTRRGTSSVAYLTLRDTDVDMSLSVTAHRQVLESMAVPLVEGARVVVRLAPQYWTKRGSFTLAAIDIRPVGVGELLARVEHLRRLLASEGLFDASRKVALPFLPRRVGLVCGRDSAAEHDVVVNAQLRWPAVRFEVRRVAVQGTSAVTAVCEAIEELDRLPDVDVLVVARGGGSLEDLLPFSNEALLRTAAACRTPLVSAIGHEADVPLLDLVADHRASTPTDAAALVVPAVAEEQAALASARQRMHRVLAGRLDGEQHRLDALRARPVIASPAAGLDQRADGVRASRDRLRRVVAGRWDRAGDEVEHLAARVGALSPAATLARGYAVVQRAAGAVLSDASRTTTGERLRIRLAAGELEAEVTAARPGSAGATS